MNEKKLKLWQKIGYGIGDFGSNYCWTFVASFALLYFTNIVGVSATVVGLIMMGSRVLDGVSDIIAGRIIDRTHSKMGKARFWYFVSAFPTALCVFLLFNIPGSFSTTTKYAYIVIVYTLMGAVFYTMSNIAYSSLTALVTKNPKERVELGSYRFCFAILALVLIQSFTSKLVEYFGGGQTGWRMISIIYALICLVALLIPVFCVHELSEEELADENIAETVIEKTSFLESMKLLIKNKYFIVILCYYLVKYLCDGITSGLGIYFTTYFLGKASLLGVISFAGMLPSVFLLPFIPQLTGKVGLRKTALFGGFVALAGVIIAFFAGSKGIILIMLIGLVMRGIGVAPITGGLNAFIASADDYSALKFGKRMTGTIYSCSSVGIKVGTGIGTAVSGFLLDASGFDGQAAVQSASTISFIKYFYLSAWVVSAVAVLVAVYFLNVEKENKKLQEEKNRIEAENKR